jgi:glycosyltransferase involved in cell wall biosynthesis
MEKPHCTDAELATWLHHARALLFPSFTEGFGIPLIEALTLRVPAIASNLPVFREFAAEIPEYLDPLDGPEWKRLILDYSRPDSARHQRQRERLKDYSAPTWENHFAVVEELVKEIRA